jgi:hypothetical protein
MEIMVCGSVGYGDVNEIRYFYSLLEKEGFGIVDHFKGKGMDYSDIEDFRDKKDLSGQIVDHDLEFVKKANILVVLANGPSYGTAIEMFVGKSSGKRVILVAKDPIPTPWPISLSDDVVRSEEELLMLLHNIKSN